MKKKIVALFLVMMMLLSITGCTSAEVGYLQLLKEYSAIENVAIDETVIIDYDGTMDQMVGWQLGKRHLEVKLSGVMNQEKLTMDVDMSYRLGDSGAFEPLCRVVMNETTMLLSTEGIWDLAKVFGAEAGWSEAFIAEADAYFAANPYVSQSLLYEGYGAEMAMQQAIMAKMDDLLDMFAQAHEGFEPGMITASADGGYEMVLDKDALVKIVDDWFAYATANPDPLYQFCVDFTNFAMEVSGEPAALSAEEIFGAPEAEAKAKFVQGLAEVQSIWNELSAGLRTMDVSDNDRYAEKVKLSGEKGSRVYEGTNTLVIDELGLKIVSEATAAERSRVTIGSGITKAVSMDDFAAGLQAITDKYTSFDRMVLVPDGYGLADVTTYGTFCGAPTEETTVVFMDVFDGSYAIEAGEIGNLFSDLRVVIDNTTVTVMDWNDQNKVVTIQGIYDEETEMLYVKCRDLALLGFDVLYEAEPERITLTPTAPVSAEAVGE